MTWPPHAGQSCFQLSFCPWCPSPSRSGARDTAALRGSGAEAGTPRHGGGRRTRALPHLPARQRGGELMRSKVRGRRRADNSLAPQAAGGTRAAEGRHLPPPPLYPPLSLSPGISSLIMRLLLVITGPLLDGRHQHPLPRPRPNSHLWLREGSPCPRSWFWHRASWAGGGWL